MFWTESSSTISLATVTPSLVMCRGKPFPLLISTNLPFGPSVTFTASAKTLTPDLSFSRASSLNIISFDIFTFYILSSYSKVLVNIIFCSQGLLSKLLKNGQFLIYELIVEVRVLLELT